MMNNWFTEDTCDICGEWMEYCTCGLCGKHYDECTCVRDDEAIREAKEATDVTCNVRSDMCWTVAGGL